MISNKETAVFIVFKDDSFKRQTTIVQTTN